MRRAQSWSIDVIIGVIIFMMIVAIFYAFLGAQSQASVEDLKADADTTSEKISGDLGILSNGEFDQRALEELCNRPYSEVKALLGIENDVCIFLEDENGNIIPCGTNNKSGIGNGDISLGESLNCGDPIV